MTMMNNPDWEVQNVNNLRSSLKFTLAEEGGYVNDPRDPGGETKWGISKKSYPLLDIKNLTPETASNIYCKDYWLASGSDSLPWPLCAVVFDTAVNCGVSRAVGWLRDSPNQSATDYIRRRKQYYLDLCQRNPSLNKFAWGWMSRLGRLQKLVDTPVTSV